MKKLSISILIFVLSFATVPAYAQYSSTAYGGINNESFLNRTSDWFATLGKSQKEKYRIKNERRAARKIKKAKKRIARQKKAFAKMKKANSK